MNMIWVLLLLFTGGVWADGFSGNVSSRPVVVNVGAIFSFDSTIGRVAKIAIEEAVKDVNSNSTLLPGTKLVVQMQNSNCSGFLGMVGALQFMETDVVAILGPQSSVVAHSISSVANELQVPILSFAATDPTLSPLQFPYFVRTTQNDLYQMQAAADIVDYYGWREVVVIFIDDDYGRNGISALGDALAARRCKIAYKAGIPPESTISKSEIMDILVKLAFLESRVIVLHVNPNLGFMVFAAAQYLGMMGNGYAWIATDWLSSVLDSSSPLPSETVDTLQGVLVLRSHSPDSDRKKAFRSKWHKLNGESFSLNSYAIYAYDAVWLVAHAIDSFFKEGGVISFSVDPNINSSGSNLHLDAMTLFDEGPRLLKNILQTSFMGLSGPIKFSPDRDLILPAYDVINVIGTGLIRGIGYWSNYSGLSTVPPETLYLKPPNRSTENQHLHSVFWPGETVKVPRGWVFPNGAKKMKIGVPIRVSFKEFVSQQKDNDTYDGFCIDVFTAAVSLLPYAVPYQFVPYGNGKENPSYTDLVKMITTGVFDAAIGDIAIVANRTKMVDFTQPYVSSGLVVVAPFKKLNTGAWAFLRPFTPSMWGVAAIFFVIMGIVVWILEHRINDEFRGSPRTQIVTVLWFSMSTLFFSHRENTVSALGRTLLLLWLFVVLIINSSYTANLTSILTVQQLYSPIKGIESLKRGDEPIGFQVGSFAEHYLSEEIGIAKSRLVPLGSPEEYASALKLGPKNGGVAAVVDERPYVELFLSDQCKFRIVGQEVKRDGWGFAFQRDSPLAVDMSGAILELSENGELQRIHDKWLQSISCDSTEIESNRLHLSSFWGLYLIFGTCCFLAIFIYFCHLIRKYYRTRKDEQIHDGEGGGSLRSGRLQTLVSLFDEKKDMKKGESKRRKLSSETSQGSELGDNSRSGHDETHIVVSST